MDMIKELEPEIIFGHNCVGRSDYREYGDPTTRQGAASSDVIEPDIVSAYLSCGVPDKGDLTSAVVLEKLKEVPDTEGGLDGYADWDPYDSSNDF